MTAVERHHRADAADALCSAAFARAVAGGGGAGMALVAVGGYGRRELAPFSDLDVVLVHADHVDAGDVASRVWYPLWDGAQVRVDHAVRALSAVTSAAADDLRVAVGMLDARHVAGDPALTLRLRTAVLAQWRRDARRRIPELRELGIARAARFGELAHASIPDLKASLGGLRDATLMKALAATWLVDVPHTELERSRNELLDLRDLVHEVAGRPTDRIGPEMWPELTKALTAADSLAAQHHVRRIGRRMANLCELTWRRVDVAGSRRARRRGPELEPVAPFVAISSGEVVLDRGADPGADPVLLLRAATAAAERGLPLSPVTATRLARETGDLPVPWPTEARHLLMRLLGSGPSLVPVWETLDLTGALDRMLPEWAPVRLLPHASAVHRFTVDRHLVETCAEAARLVRRVRRPDLLLLAALLHDIGKASLGEHSAAGAPIARSIAERVGFSSDDASRIAELVRWHLFLAEIATTRDLDDPGTVRHVASRVQDRETLALLAALTEADARATSVKAWTSWRAGLVAQLVSRVDRHLGLTAASPLPRWERPLPSRSIPVPETLVQAPPRRVDVRVEGRAEGSRLVVCSDERERLFAAVAGVLALNRASIRSGRAWTADGFAFSVWDVADAEVDPLLVNRQLEAVLEGRLDPSAHVSVLPPASPVVEPGVSVMIDHDASADATVLEVRAGDGPGVVHRVCATLADLGLSVRSAHLSTFGPQAVDVFYVQEAAAGALADERAAEAAHAIRRVLGDTVTLDG